MSSALNYEDEDDEFDIFIEELGAEIDNRAFSVMKRLCIRKQANAKYETMKYPSELMFALVDAAVISQNDLEYLSKILKVAKQTKLADRVKEYENRHNRKQDTTVRRKRKASDSDISYKRQCFDFPVPIKLEEVSFKDRALYWAAMEVFTRSMVQIQSNDAAVDVKARQMNEAFEKLGVNLTGVKISSVILLARCWSMNGLMSFKDGLKSRKLVVLLTDILITDELKDLVKGTGITLRISADVDPIHLERAEKYFEDTAIETELFKYDKVDVVHRSSPTLMSVNYLNLFTMAYQPNRKLNSLRKSVRLIQIARKESFKTKEVIRSLEVRVREKDRVINEKQKRLTALVEEHCDLPPQKSLGASGIEKDTLNSEVRELHELLTDETSQIVAMNETVREKDAVIDSLTSELQIEKLKFPVVSVRLRLERTEQDGNFKRRDFSSRFKFRNESEFPKPEKFIPSIKKYPSRSKKQYKKFIQRKLQEKLYMNTRKTYNMEAD